MERSNPESERLNPALRVLVVQDHPLLAAAIAGILRTQVDLAVCGIAQTGADAVRLSLREDPAVVLMDFDLPDMTGPAAAVQIRAEAPNIAIVFHSADESETALLDAIDAGATAYLTKAATSGEIVEAIRRAARGDVLISGSLFAKAIARQRMATARQEDRERLATLFTVREMEVLHLMAEGLNTAAMSRRLGIAPHTIEWHVRHVIEKLHGSTPCFRR